MRLRTLLLSGVLASGLALTFVPPVAADPPPWAGARGHDNDHHHWRHRNGDHRDYNRNGYYRNDRGYRGNDPQYGKLVDRMNNDRAKIAEIGPTGRHRKALQWYRDDLRNAERDMHNYRDRRTSNDIDSSGRYYESRYDNGAEASFDWSNMLGTLINPTQ
jgi:hypothetical protein